MDYNIRSSAMGSFIMGFVWKKLSAKLIQAKEECIYHVSSSNYSNCQTA